ncbi:GNAT family N-acetyltransferase [Tamlana crocina]|uniref:GNAT family N-acetyltransferase n=1 Tax=Tamlana crocina TaxID=393006 RepID=A0ABX1DD85_9FLAO|nr:GNAT family N-acetyltransferase [Tamlana crocina]NJX15171.1 GNAT family N-acetyltransferase [Tamlana crocina]
MLTNLRIKNNFYSDLFEKEKVSKAINRLELKIDGSFIYQSNESEIADSNIHTPILVPDYLNVTLTPHLTARNVYHKKGYGVNVKSISDIDSYLKENAGTNFKKNTLRTLKRLENCFNIKYEMFFGNIEKPTYNNLMDTLLSMIQNRFQERKGRNRVIEDWEYYKSICYDLINSKSGSIFVIYSGEEPIEISLNFHQDTIMYSAISSYNLDYHKFSLGNVEIYRQLEWCLKNNISFFDMGYGNFDYKIKWSNLAYNFNTLVISKNDNFIVRLYTLYLKNKYRFINYLIEKEVMDTVRNLLSTFKPQKKQKAKLAAYKFEDCNTPINEELTPIKISDTEYAFLQKPLNEFLYASTQHISKVKIFYVVNTEKTFVFQGPKKSAKLIFKKDN